MSQSTTTPIKQAKPLASSTGEKDAIHMIEKLEIKTKAINANNIARTANSHLATTKDTKLHPLYSLKTGKALEKYPDTSRGLGKLSVTVVDAMLSALEADRTGNEMEKREKLRLQIGLVPNPA